MDELLQAQIALILAIQSIPGLTGIARIFTFLGEEQFFIVLLPLIYLSVNSVLGVRLAYVLLTGASVNYLAKLTFHMPRPYWINTNVQYFVEEASYGIPSGHAQNATVVWLFLASVIRKTWFWVVAVLLVLLISFSRVYLGVHFFTDLIGGWALAILFLVVFLALEPKVTHWLGNQAIGMQIAAAFLFSVSLILLGLLIRALISGVIDPDLWASWSVESRSLEGITTNAGALFGIGVGWAMARHWAPFNAGGPFLKRAVRFIIGFVVVAILYLGLSAIFPREPELIALPFRFLRYTLMGWSAIFLVPWLCLRIGLAEVMRPEETQSLEVIK
jgi:membrane-associated phospholipid phosphatase